MRERTRIMFRLRCNPLFLVLLLSIFISSNFCICDGTIIDHLHQSEQTRIPEVIDGREFNGKVDEWNERRRSVAETPEKSSSSSNVLILAANRTHRRCPIAGFRYYNDGWNLTNKHYLFSVAYSAAGPFLLAAVWFVVFGIILLCMCLRRCCCCVGKSIGYSKAAYALSLTFLILFTIGAIAGAVFLYSGQQEFHSSIVRVLSFILYQADFVIENIQNVFNYLLSAKLALPGDFQLQIDAIQQPINFVANQLRNATRQTEREIRNFLDPNRFYLISISASLLTLAFLGFLFSVLGFPCLVYMLGIIGWIVLVFTFILTGMSLLIHNAVGDTCVALEEWVQNPKASSALEHVLPKVDDETSQKIYSLSKGSTVGLVKVLNVDIVANVNIDPSPGSPQYYNQSGPMLPLLCNPYNPDDLTDRKCEAGEVALPNATEVWKNYICKVSSSGICVTPGRLTQDRYSQMAGPVNASYHLYHYTPFLIDLIDSNFVKVTFARISKENCPDLVKYSRWTYVGFNTSSVCVMMSMFLWVIYARERRHRKYTKKQLSKAPPAAHLHSSRDP
ncbi:uncharacterized protein LOC132278441 [Cornus florida]|uniref:uncharacterized protein LOC132278441 n=1 Tax=Cornus florida TaxID=4283 RepID=UPI00289A5E6D|nr:uncharacterized protein LOC132278441 [Cornus florida]